MVDEPPRRRVLSGSDTASSHSRLSSSTINPRSTIYEDTKQELEIDVTATIVDSYAASGDIHKRTLSFRSHKSTTASSCDTDDTSSPFESAGHISSLFRSSSSASTTPTSPELEVAVHHQAAKARETHAISSGSIVSSTPHTPSPSEAERLAAAPQKAIGLSESVSRQQHAMPDEEEQSMGELADASRAALQASQEETALSHAASPSTPKFVLGTSIASNRNKPLPPVADFGPSSSNLETGREPVLPIPTLSVSPALTQRELDGFAIDSAPSSDDASPRASRHGSLRSMLNRSSKLFRTSSEVREFGISVPTGITSTEQKWTPPQNVSAFGSNSSLPWQRSNSSSPNSSQARLSDSSLHNEGRSPTEAGRSESASPSRSALLTRLSSSWRASPKTADSQGAHLKAPSPSSSTYSSSPDHIQGHSSFLSASSAELVYSVSSSKPDSMSRNGTDKEAGKTHDWRRPPKRPPLNRNRSRSMDVLDLFKNNNAAPGLTDLAGVRGNDSIAIGMTSPAVEAELTLAPIPSPAQTVEGSQRQTGQATKSVESFGFFRPLTTRRSFFGLKELHRPLAAISAESVSGADQNISPTVHPKEVRERTFSRLTESLRHKRLPSVPTEERAANPCERITIQGKDGEDHRTCSEVFVIGHSTSLRERREVVAIEVDSRKTSQVAEKADEQRHCPEALLQQVCAASDTQSGSAPAKVLADFSTDPSIAVGLSSAATGPVSLEKDDDWLKDDANAAERYKELFTQSCPPCHSRQESSDGEDYASAFSSMTASNSAASSREVSLMDRSAPPTSYRTAIKEEHRSKMTKSESDPSLFVAGTGTIEAGRNVKPSHTSAAAANSPAFKSIVAPHRRSHSTTKALEGTAKTSMSSFFALRLASDLDGESELPPRQFSRPREPPPWAAGPKQRQRVTGKRALTVDVEGGAKSASQPGHSSRSRSALAMAADMEGGSQIHSPSRPKQRRPSQATLSIADDSEFLQALEHVRKVNQERIRRQQEEAGVVEAMARLGMASGNKRAKSHKGKSEWYQQEVNPVVDGNQIRCTTLHRRSSSADGHIIKQRNLVQAEGSASLKCSRPAEKPSALELGVGKASGKLRDGAFLNDDDWKREVNALFVIRELVLTERSYARHLEALLEAVHTLQRASETPKKTTNGSNSRSNGQIPTHLVVLRTLLPQLITLSHSLANRIDENPTAAGVGTAFRLVGSQMEAAFVAWSVVAKDIMEALRSSEKSKSKAKDRIGLITLAPLEHVPSEDKKLANGFVSVPCSPASSRFPKQAYPGVNTTNSQIASLVSTAIDDSTVGESRPSKRRSTLSGITPAIAANLRAVKNLTPTSNESVMRKKADPPHFDTLPSPARSTIIPSRSHTPITAALRSSIPLPLALERGNNDGEGEDGTAAAAAAAPAFLGKKLSALDVAIMPTQRLPRYLLLLRDLNSHTPPQSLSHVRLVRCLDFVKSVTSKCNEASKGKAK